MRRSLALNSKLLNIWTIFDHPIDYPDHYVARLFIVGNGNHKATASVILCNDLDELRGKLPPNLIRLPRDNNDDRNIIESWL
jgi:hypothetical protein